MLNLNYHDTHNKETKKRLLVGQLDMHVGYPEMEMNNLFM